MTSDRFSSSQPDVRFLSVCSGIEAASVAWNPLGWKAWAFSEIEPFPSSVLAHHYPDTPNLGDMTKFKDWPDASVSLLCGGTPCQSFSNAGLRAGLDDPRGQLMLTFGAIAARYRPRWLVWENVPGVLSSNGGRDFGAFLGLLGFLGYGFAYRVLDAQFVRVDGYARAVPQRRQRVFVVGCLGDWRSAAAVLLERESLRGDPAPRRSSGVRVAGALGCGSPASGGRVGADEAAAGQIVSIQGNLIGRDKGGPVGVGVGVGVGGEMFTLTKADVHGVAICPPTVSPALKARDYKGPSSDGDGDGDGAPLIVHTLRGEGFDASEDGTGRGIPLIPFDTTQLTSAANRSNPKPGDPCHPLAAGAHPPAVAFGWQNAAAQGMPVDSISPTLDKSKHPATATATAVRRLMPVECERLQGFPDSYTSVMHRGKPAADGPRYKALGNSWAIPPVRWIGLRIAMVDALQVRRAEAA